MTTSPISPSAVPSSAVNLSGGNIRYPVGAGAAIKTDRVSDTDEFMKAADLALSLAKRAGANRVAQP